MKRAEITAATRVKVTRVVVASDTVTLAELAEGSGEDLADVIASFRNGAGTEWMNLYGDPRLIEALPSVECADSDTWTAQVLP